jgi:uncharacterized protein YraI
LIGHDLELSRQNVSSCERIGVQALKHVESTAFAGKALHWSDDRLSGSTIMRKLLILGLASLLLAIPIAASAQEGYTTRSVNVRAGPDTSYPAVAVLGGGAPVQVMGCLDDWSWCDVVFGYNRGWVYAPYLNYVYQGVRVPFYTYAPSFGIPIISFSVGSYWDRYYRGRPWYGRRDYWERREPQHVRPPGPSPRSTPPSYRERSEYQARGAPSGRPAYTDNRGTPPVGNNRPPREAGSPPPERRGYPGAPGGGPPPSSNQPHQEMRRASPTQGGPPPAAAQGGPPRGGEKSHPAEGDKGHGKEGGKQEEKQR